MYSMKFFETIKCEDYEIFNLDFHKKRIANTVGLNINLEEYIYPPNAKLIKCKLIYDECGVTDVLYDVYVKKDVTSFQLVYDDNIKYNKKALLRDDLDALSEKRKKSDEIIIVKNNLITDTSIANIAIYLDEEWITPKVALLEGTTKARYVENNILKLKDITLEMLKNCTEFATLNAMIGFNIIEDFKIEGYKK
ncbi:MAG: branched-chain amino acid aminotransferase [Campylobacteraceae bacterium]|nr:branched-chain amino acid aminotransferase [Campylobacteraceae bacterium]MBT4572139.1 branched-chain amino acid aminotransferase [Campylobacteraceae bacterium]MBT4708398.1 branched-chain amino acid aminotransferase [Campylobacteraceae bacterium]MBT5323191.1 branched-chain amino acid aminotransferase [Campylobacteraceae bacterium]MBT5982494.1 branched-chain amino acid aminotransferase [Campylobacteraceae bacterium]